MAQAEITVPIWKDDSKHIVYGVVLQPDLKDSQGDTVTADEIEKAAHRFLVNYRKHDVQHTERAAGVQTVESYIAPQDLEIAGQQVSKGSWVMGTHVADPEIWERVSKQDHEQPLTGYSIGGSGVRLDD